MTDEWLTNYTYDAAGNLTLSAGSGVPSTTRADTYNATQQLVTSFTRTGQQPTSRIQTATDTRYDALGRRIWIKKVSQCSGTPEDTQHFCRTSYVRRTAWDGDQEIAEFQGGEEDTGTFGCGTPRSMQQGLPSEDECPLWGQTLYVHGNSLNAPLAVVRSNYREYQYVNPQWNLRTFPTFVLYPLWNARGEPDLATSLTGKNTVCVTTDTPPCAQDFGWPAGMTPYMQQRWVKLSWLGSLLDDKRDAGLASGLTYRRNRYVDGRTGRFTQPDPIGLAGGLNAYGYADDDPVSFSDPFGLCATSGAKLDNGECPAERKTQVWLHQGLENAVSPLDLLLAGSGVSLIQTIGGIVFDSREVWTRGSVGGPGAGKRFDESTQDEAERLADGKCEYCGRSTARDRGPAQRNTDHANPISRNGDNSLSNAVNSCRTCNIEKRDMTVMEYLGKKVFRGIFD